MRKRALVLTVGVGSAERRESYRRAVQRAIEEANPDRVCFLCTAESEGIARAVADTLRLGRRCEYRRLVPMDDLEQAFVEASRAIEDLERCGFRADDIKVDFTFGTKAMTAGAALGAVARRTGSLQYVSGPRSADGLVQSGRERVVAFVPGRVFALRDLGRAHEMTRALMFRPAERLLTEVLDGGLLPEEPKAEAESLRRAALAYDAWDRFDYKACLDGLRGVELGGPRLGDLAMGPDTRRRLGDLCKYSDTRGGRAAKYTPDRIADLFCNATRRVHEGRYDDAVARLYRAAEMLAQWRLQERWGLDPGDLDLRRLPGELRTKYEGMREPNGADTGNLKVGLQRCFELLEGLGDPLGTAFRRADGLRQGLATRNSSLLAHGVRPVSREDCESLQGEFKKLADDFLGPEFPTACTDLTFPWMREAG